MSGFYPASGVDSGQISPSDAAVTLRSLSRRFASAVATPDDDDRPEDAIRRRPGNGGLSAIEHTAWVAVALPGLHLALDRIGVESEPTIEVPPLDPTPPIEGADRSAADIVAAIATEAGRLADAIDAVSGDDWLRAGRLSDVTVTAIDVARGAVQLSIYHLRGAVQTLSEVVREAP